MDCEKCREILWDKEEFSADEVDCALEHVKECSECERESAIIEEIKNADIPLPFSVSDKVLEKVRNMEKSPRRNLKFVRIGAVACALILVSVVSLRIAFPPAKEANDSALKVESESVNDGGYDFVTKNESYSDNDIGGVVEEPMSPIPDEPMAEAPMEDAKNEKVEEDMYMLLDFYKDAMEISSHTADIVILGNDVEGVFELLFDYTPEDFETHIEMKGDVLYNVESVLKKAGHSVLFTSSSENPRKTVVYFIDYLS